MAAKKTGSNSKSIGKKVVLLLIVAAVLVGGFFAYEEISTRMKAADAEMGPGAAERSGVFALAAEDVDGGPVTVQEAHVADVVSDKAFLIAEGTTMRFVFSEKPQTLSIGQAVNITGELKSEVDADRLQSTHNLTDEQTLLLREHGFYIEASDVEVK